MESHFHVVVVVVVAILVGCVGPLAAQPLTDSSLESPPQTVDADDSTRTVQVVQDESGLEADAKAKRLSDQVREVLEHFKQTNPTGFPGADIPDPMAVPPMNTSFAIGTMSFSNVTTHGLGKFRFHEANVNLTAMKTEVAARIDKVLIVGNYTLSTWFGYSEGGFVVTLDGVLVKGVAGLEVGPGGRLRAEEIGMDVTFDKIAMDFKNLGFLMSVFQGIINKVGSFLFDNVKPFILSEVNTKIREEVDKQVAGISVRFPTSMTPIDVVVADARHLVRTMGFDPYHLPDVTKKVGPVEATLSHLFATGLSSFYRRGDVTLWMRDNVLHAGVHLATRTLRGTCRWTVHAPNLPAVLYPLMRKGGDASFTIDYLEAKIVVNQSLDTRNHPYLESLDLTLGPLTLVSRGDAGKLNHISEFGMNVVPNLLRYQIVDALEQPISQRIQEVLDDVSVEDIINERLDDLDRLAAESSTAESPSHVVTTPSTPLATSTPTPVTPTIVATTIPAS